MELSDDELGAMCLVPFMLTFCSLLLLRRQKRRVGRLRRRQYWTKDWLLKRGRQGAFHNLISEFQLSDPDSFRSILRMDVECFSYLVEQIEPLIRRQNTGMRESIGAKERLAITLRFLASGETYRSLSYLYRVHETTIGRIVPETCVAIRDVLAENYYQCPNTEAAWLEVEQGFRERWHFPHCVGAVDGKHVGIKPPANSGSLFFNYKHSFSIVLMAVVDSDYNFLYVDIGSNGRMSDGGVFGESSFESEMNRGNLNLPSPQALPGTQTECAYFLVGDEAFALKCSLMKPYPRRNLSREERVFNYRLSRARRVVENAFGILANRFRIFLSPINLAPEKVEVVVHACCALHNMLRTRCGENYLPQGSVDTENTEHTVLIPGEWRNDSVLQPARTTTYARNSSAAAKDQRNRLRDYFMTPIGALTWQEEAAGLPVGSSNDVTPLLEMQAL